jgi:hypothetical protein
MSVVGPNSENGRLPIMSVLPPKADLITLRSNVRAAPQEHTFPRTKRWTDAPSSKAVQKCSRSALIFSCLSGGRGNDGFFREQSSTIVNKVLQAMSCNIQGGGIHCTLVARRGLGTLSLQDVVNFVFDDQ